MTALDPISRPAEAVSTEWLRRENIEAWRAATTHKFVQELADDRIDDSVFRRYLVQDFVFVETLVELVAYSIAKAPDMAAKRRLSGFLYAVTGDETNYFELALSAVGAAEAFRSPPPLNEITQELRSLMIETASSGSYADILAILVPAEWIYLTWASSARAAGKRPKRFYLDDWIELHAIPAFASFVDWCRGELDRQLAEDGAVRERVAELFAETVRLEVKFFDAAYE